MVENQRIGFRSPYLCTVFQPSKLEHVSLMKIHEKWPWLSFEKYSTRCTKSSKNDFKSEFQLFPVIIFRAHFILIVLELKSEFWIVHVYAWLYVFIHACKQDFIERDSAKFSRIFQKKNSIILVKFCAPYKT